MPFAAWYHFLIYAFSFLDKSSLANLFPFIYYLVLKEYPYDW